MGATFCGHGRWIAMLLVGCGALPGLPGPWQREARGQEPILVIPAELPAPAPEQALDLMPVDPARLEGHDKCVDCHRAEFAAWQTSHHAIETFDMLRTGDYAKQSAGFCQKLGIPLKEIAKSSICIRCHATRMEESSGVTQVLPGVSCEACHGASGGDDGWLNLHAVYGPNGTPREAETAEHREMRVDRCVRAGQLRVDNPFRLAGACYRCHIIWDQQLVDVAEHPSASERFEFAAWSLGEVRHNFHFDQSHNALVSTLWANPVDQQRDAKLQDRLRLMFLAGKLAQLQVALGNRALATSDGDFAADMEDIIEDARDTLEEYVEDYSEEDEDDKGYNPDDLPSLQAAVRATDAAFALLEEAEEAVDDDDRIPDEEKEAEFFRRSAQGFRRAAELVAEAGDQFCAEHDGSRLQVVDDDLPIITDDEDNEAHYSDAWKRRHGLDE
jgi:hypothetical protein